MPSKCWHYGNNAPATCNECSRYDPWGGGSIGFGRSEGDNSCQGRYFWTEGLEDADYTKTIMIQIEPTAGVNELVENMARAAAEFEDRFIAGLLANT